uniref:G-protein coupled receptors family 1 profile domain-containing protein n=1 Tax=Cynoglossus semilaevis TaxID=244447 RepID=A0A3P8UZX6_CYNSE
MEAVEEAELYVSQINDSCRRTKHPYMETTFTYVAVSCIIVLTAVLNLLVIISISHFRQLHTTTNLLLLSLAVSDCLVGILLMPFLLLFQYPACRSFCDIACVVSYFLSFVLVSVSVGNMVLISVDRYIAICNPMFYTTRVTLGRVKLSVGICWICSLVHSCWILRDVLKQPNAYRTSCGECVIVVNLAEGVVDLVVTFAAPILVIVILYLRVFVVAVSQARAMRSHITTVELGRSKTTKAEKSELKAARVLGIVVVVFLLCSFPYYGFTLAAESGLVSDSSYSIVVWFMYSNSTLNPVIYVVFYPWFKKTIRHIFTLQLLQPGSGQTRVL